MLTHSLIGQAADYLRQAGLGGWLLFDYRDMNPTFAQVAGEVRMVTRPCYLLITPQKEATLLVHQVDLGRFRDAGLDGQTYASRADLLERLGRLLQGRGSVAMEYSPGGALPRASRVDAGTIELVRSLGVEVVSSADLAQHLTQRWSPEQLASHRRAAHALGQIVEEAFRHCGEHLATPVTEHQVAQLIRQLYAQHGLVADDGPVVAVNAHANDPHYEPPREGSATIGRGDWVLIDLWAREGTEAGTFADITWVGYAGSSAPEPQARVFVAVAQARDAAVDFVQAAFREGRPVEGWEVDQVARRVIQEAGYGPFFVHRLGHSLGREVHADAVNLDDYETHDTRKLIPGIGFTIEPGVYLPDFGVRSEIDLFFSAQEGPVVTTPVQREVVVIGVSV